MHKRRKEKRDEKGGTRREEVEKRDQGEARIRRYER
jgi:hypothetical protein